MIFDSHAHYDDEAFDEDREEVLQEVQKSGISYIVNAGASIESSKASVELAGKHQFIYAAVGIHPQDADKFNDDSPGELESLAGSEKVVAIGEIGLDYYWEGPHKDIQKKAFEEQVRLALKLNLPVIIHDRDAHGDTFDMVRKYASQGLLGVLHCYSGSPEMAVEYVKMGFYIGLTGVITFKNAVKSLEVLKAMPMDRILIETDCPYLAPVPFRGKRNDSRYLKHVAEKACQVLDVDYEYFIEKTCRNARDLFKV